MQIRVNENKSVVAVNSTELIVKPVIKQTRVVINRNDERIVVNKPSTTVRIVSTNVLQRVVLDSTKIRLVTVAKQGPPGAPGNSGPDIDAMVNPLYEVCRREFEFGPSARISKVSVLSGLTGGTVMFERTIEYDGDRIVAVQTDDVLNHTRLKKTMVYDDDGELVGVRREVTTWQ